MDTFTIINTISIILFFGLLVLFFISLGLFIRSRVVNQTNKQNSLIQIEQKLDKLIELMEKQQKD